jgi:sensor histidine kinase YesM
MSRNKLIKSISLVVLIWLTVTFLTGFIYAGTELSLSLRVWKTAGLWYFNIVLLLPVIFWISSRISFERFSKTVFFGIHGVIALGFAALWTVFAFLDLNIYEDPDIKRYLNRMYLQYFNIGIFIYAAVAGWIYTLHYHRRSKEQAVREADLKRMAREAELKALKAQINPHFLFNALNSVNSLMVKDPERAREMNAQLAGILRYALDGSEKEIVTLRKEMGFVEDYLGIEKIRLENKLQIKINMGDGLMDIKVPPMTLQPIVENAIKHGIAGRTKGGSVSISAEVVNDKLKFQVNDTGNGIDTLENNTMLERGVGLRNTLERLKRLYDDNFSFNIQNNNPSGCIVTLYIPIRKKIQ